MVVIFTSLYLLMLAIMVRNSGWSRYNCLGLEAVAPARAKFVYFIR